MKTLTALLALSVIPAHPQGIITTVAGTEWVFPRGGLSAKDAPLGRVTALALDAAGNLLAADSGNHVVVKVASDGRLAVFAGNGQKGFSGDGGAATAASIDTPNGLAVDTLGNIYISDSGNARVRMVTPAGIISTFAGTGRAGFSGDGGPAARADLFLPRSLALDSSGALYISDAGNARVRKVSAAGIITTVAGNGQTTHSGDGGPAVSASFGAQGYCLPSSAAMELSPACPSPAIALDPQGNLYIADQLYHRVRRVDASGIITTFAGTGQWGFGGDGGPASGAMLYSPYGIATDAAGNVYISDSENYRIRKVTRAGMITTIVGSGAFDFGGDGGPAISAALKRPTALVVGGSGDIYVSDSENLRIRRVTAAGAISTLAGNGAYRFAGDGAKAVTASLYYPRRAAVDAAGNLYLADTESHRVRKISANGIIATAAGTGQWTANAGPGPATQVSLAEPSGVAMDAQGNLLIADTFHRQVRRVGADGAARSVPGTEIADLARGAPGTTDGIYYPEGLALDSSGNLYIAAGYAVYRVSAGGAPTLFAGKLDPSCRFGVCSGFAGDGGPATAAQLWNPVDVAVDADRNVYIADSANHRIRRVAPDGTIATVAGNGNSGYAGDGGPARDASLNNPSGVTIDAEGNLYIADTNNHRIRRVSKTGAITTIAGNGRPGFAGDGGLATDASLYLPTDVKLDRAGNLYTTDSGNSRIRLVMATAPSYQVSPGSLSFSAMQGGAAPAAKTISLTSVMGLNYIASASTKDGGAWLRAGQASGQMPGTLDVAVDQAGLDPGAYEGTIAISVAGGSPPSRTVAVTLKVDAPPAQPELSLETRELTFSLVQGGGESSAQLSVGNRGGGMLAFTATASGGDWLQVNPSSGTATPVQAATITVTVRATKLEPGTYQGKVTVASATASRAVPVTLMVSAPQQVIVLSQTGFSFTAVAQGGVPLPQSLAILNVGQGSMAWTARASTLSGGSGWLQVTPASGVVARPYVDVSTVSVVVNATGLAPGEYYGRIQVQADAVNSPQSATIALTVLPQGSRPGPEVQPTGLVFLGAAGVSPGSQDVKIANPKSETDRFLSASIGNWYTYTPSDAVVAPDRPSVVRVFPDFTKLPPGVTRGTITLQFEDGTPRNISLLSVAAPPGTPTAGARAAVGCSSSALRVQFTSLRRDFIAAIGQGTAIETKIVDDCANPLEPDPGRAIVQVVARFSNGDPEKELTHIGNGVWTGTWRPVNRSPEPVVVTVSATFSADSVQQAGQASVSGAVQEVGRPPVLTSAGIVNSATATSGPAGVGSLITIYGANLAESSAGAATATQVYLGAQQLSLLYAGNGQVNVQVPYDTPPNSQQQIVIVRGNTASVPETLTIAPVQPGIYTQDMSGSGQGVIVKSDMVTVARPGSPASRGDVVVIYATGLGPVTPPVLPGQPAPASPLSQTANPVTVTIGGRQGEVWFAGLTPGFLGLYQVNVVVPADADTGDQVPVTLTVAGRTSPAATMAVQ